MQRYEYRVVPAPIRGEKARGLKSTEDRFAYAMTLTLNELAADGWEYVRSDTLPCEERSGLTGRTTTYQNLLTFRRPVAASAAVEMARTLVATPPAPAAAPVAPASPAPVAAPSLTAAYRPAAVVPMRPEPARPAETARPSETERPDSATGTNSGTVPRLGPAD